MPDLTRGDAAKNIASEERRIYTFPFGTQVVIEQPITLIVSDNGHRIADSEGNGHYIPMGWIHLKWINKNGCPAIVC